MHYEAIEFYTQGQFLVVIRRDNRNAPEFNWVESLIFEVGDTKTVIWHWIERSSGECRQILGPSSNWINAEMHKEQT